MVAEKSGVSSGIITNLLPIAATLLGSFLSKSTASGQANLMETLGTFPAPEAKGSSARQRASPPNIRLSTPQRSVCDRRPRSQGQGRQLWCRRAALERQARGVTEVRMLRFFSAGGYALASDEAVPLALSQSEHFERIGPDGEPILAAAGLKTLWTESKPGDIRFEVVARQAEGMNQFAMGYTGRLRRSRRAL